MLPQVAHLPAVHMPPLPGPCSGQVSPAAMHSVSLPVPRQQPPALHARLAQQGWLGPPQASHSPPLQARPAPQVLPLQQGPPATPQVWHDPPLQVSPAPVQIWPVQQAWLSAWPQPAQTPLVHMPPLPAPTAPHIDPVATQRGVKVDPAAQQPPALQVVRLQHGSPGPPHDKASTGAVVSIGVSVGTGTSAGASDPPSVWSPPAPPAPATGPPPVPPTPVPPRPVPPLPPRPLPPTPVPPAPMMPPVPVAASLGEGAGSSSQLTARSRTVAAAIRPSRKPPLERTLNVFCTRASLGQGLAMSPGRRLGTGIIVNPSGPRR